MITYFKDENKMRRERQKLWNVIQHIKVKRYICYYRHNYYICYVIYNRICIIVMQTKKGLLEDYLKAKHKKNQAGIKEKKLREHKN